MNIRKNQSFISDKEKKEVEKKSYYTEEGLSRVQKINKLVAKLSSPKAYEFLPKEDINDSVVIIGKTGSGKSTLINLIAGQGLIGYKEKGSHIIDVCKQKKAVSEIYHGGNSGTQTPKYWCDYKRECVYFDCPGFFDNKGQEREIINAFYIRQVFKKSKRIKIILVIENSLTDSRKNELLQISKGLSDMVGGQVQKLFGKVLLIVTKAPIDDDSDDIKERLQNLLQSSSKTEEYTSITRFFQHIIKEQLLVCFHKQKGDVKSDQLNEEIISKLKRLNYFSSDTYPVVSSATKLFVRDCLEIAKEESLNHLRDFSQNAFKYYMSQLMALNQDRRIKDIEQLYHKISILADKSQVLIPICNLSIYSTEFVQRLRKHHIFIPYDSLKMLNHNYFTVDSADFYTSLLKSDLKQISFLLGQVNVSDVLHSVFMNPIINKAYQFKSQLVIKIKNESKQRQIEKLKIQHQNILKSQKIKRQYRQKQLEQQIEEQKKITKHIQETENKRIEEVKQCSRKIQYLKEQIARKQNQIKNTKGNKEGCALASIGTILGGLALVLAGPVGWFCWGLFLFGAGTVLSGLTAHNAAKYNNLKEQLKLLKQQLQEESKNMN